MSARFAALAAMLAAGLFGVGPALAQDSAADGDLTDAQYDELYCVYDAMEFMDDDLYFVMLEAGISREAEVEGTDEAVDAIIEMTDACAEEYDWNDEQVMMAISVGVAAAVGEELEFALMDAGLDDKDFDAVLNVIDQLSDEEISAFMHAGWRKDAALRAKVVSGLKAAALPDDPAVVSDLVEYIEAGIVGAMQTELWIANEAQ